MKNNQSPQRTPPGRCEYLGLKDDPKTCLAYPSSWNYCHHVRPPQSIREEYQGQYCHTSQHVQCPFYQSETNGPLPPDVQGRHYKKGKAGKRKPIVWAWLLILILAALVIWLFAKTNMLLRVERNSQITTVENSVSTMNSGTSTQQSGQLVGIFPFLPSAVPSLVEIFPIVTEFNFTPAIQTPKPSFVGVCGYALDETFGPTYKFVVHQAKPGESLNMYAVTYQTSVEAIQSINYRLPIPLRSGWVLVIPIGQTQVDNLPSFEPYFASPSDGSIEKLAGHFSIDLTQLEQYNEIDKSCIMFSGWLLIPRKKTSP